MSEPNPTVVWLTDLRFADLKPKQRSQPNQTEAISGKSSTTTTYQEQTSLLGTFSRHTETKTYDRLAADKPGDELTADATIWKLYVSEAQNYDGELVERQHRNIDVMLVFAALFSAILTSFLLDSKSMMQQDPSDITNVLLKVIAQRLENPNSPFKPVEIPVFEPTDTARWINGLWFTSLGLSLAAALLAMLAKEWLATFASSRPRQAYAFAIERQARLDALSSWGALLMIDHLPLFLHVALLLFALGLILYLYSKVDPTVAAIITAITGTTLLFYAIATGLATLYEVCPFDTQLSLYSRRALKSIIYHWGLGDRYKRYFDIKAPKSPERTTKQDLHALRWLFKYAQDPRVGDSAYQALAGLRLRATEASETSPTLENTPPGTKNGVRKNPGRKLKLVTNMFVDICHRLDQARIENPQNLAVLFGTNVARYVSTLSHFVGYMLPHQNQERLAEFAWARFAKIGVKSSQGTEKTFDPAKTALDALDSILHNGCPPFTADAYAWITAGELTLTTAITNAIENQKHQALLTTGDTSETLSGSPPAGAVAVDTRPKPVTTVELFDLRARYSRSLTRASFQLLAHAEGTASMSASSLIYILNSVSNAARCDGLNPPTSLSTHHPQDPENSSMLPNFYVDMVGSGLNYYLNPGVIGYPDGILGGILNVLGALGTYPVAAVEIAAGHALKAVAPRVLGQWLHLLGDSLSEQVPTPSPASWSLDKESLLKNAWPSEASSDADKITTWVLTQTLHLAAFANLYSDRPGIEELLLLSLRAFTRRSRNCYPEQLPAQVALNNIQKVKHLISTVPYELAPTQGRDSISDNLLQLLAFKNYENHTVYSRLVSAECIGPIDLFRLIDNTSTAVAPVERLLADISKDGSRDLLHFSKSDGFYRLLQIAGCSEYVPAVVRCVYDLVTKATTPFEKSFEDGRVQSIIATADVDAFLEIVGVVLKHPLPSGKKAADLTVFLSRFYVVLQSLQANDNARQISKQLPRTELENIMQSKLANSSLKNVVSAVLEKFKPEENVDSSSQGTGASTLAP